MKPYYHDEKAGITIYHGDCRDILPQLESVDLVLTDPPYGAGVKYGNSYSDDPTTYWDWFIPTVEIMRGAGRVLAFTHRVKSIGMISGWDWIGVWNKPYSAGNRIGNSWVLPHWEPIYFFGIHASGRQGQLRNSHFRSDVFTFNPEDGGPTRGFGTKERNRHSDIVNHPTIKPLDLFTELAGLLSEPGQILCDPFVGGGTTLRAAKDLGRKAIGIEIEEKYCEIAAERLGQEVLEFGR
jgi:site-specific DNA-methyltransferase (adenine-specific)